jgi:hypothetical protein
LQAFEFPPVVSSVLDKINLSDHQLTILAAAIAKVHEQDLDSAPQSQSTVQRKRKSHHSANDAAVWQKFLSQETFPHEVHWDGKLMKDGTNLENKNANTDRFVVAVTGRC